MLSRPYTVAEKLQVVDKVLEAKRSTERNYIGYFWAMLFLCLSCAIYLELTYRAVDWPLLETYPIIWYSASVLMTVFFINGLFLLLRYVVSRFRTSTLEITERQQRLCGISNSDPRFLVVSSKSTAITASTVSAPQYSPSSYTGRPSYSCRPSPGQRSLMMTSMSPFSDGMSLNSSTDGLCPQEVVTYNWSPLPLDRSGRSPVSGTASSFAGHQGSVSYMSSLLNSSYQSAGTGSTSRGSPGNWVSGFSPSGVSSGSPTALSAVSPHDSSPSHLVWQDVPGGSGTLRSQQHARQRSRSSPLKSDDFITNPQDLDSYLQSTSASKDQRLQNDFSLYSTIPGISETHASQPSGFSFWSFNRTLMDYIPMLRRYRYQLAPHSLPQSTTSVDNPQLSFTSCAVTEDVWSKLEVDHDQVDRWIENLRKWICRTILNRLVEEIAEVNKALVNIGSEDIQIGEVSLSMLKQWASAKGQLVPKLTTLVPFLDLSTNQEYLVQRLRELSSGGCMSAFKWNGGGEFKGKTWEENLPTDSAIVMHLLCCYMDLRLPPHPKYPDGKTFTCQHFLSAPSMQTSDLKDRKDHLLIYEVRLNPPHYNIVIDDSVWNVKPGRNNLFHAILLFLYHIKTKEHGMLRRVSLGMSGINILWVLDS